ncbi:MAG: PKD domain-containing protein [Flavobacteriales bacterium]
MIERIFQLRGIFPSVLVFAATTQLVAQTTYQIDQGAINACEGALLDSGGQGAGGYGNNENYTAVVCPDTPGGAISLQWITANLSTAGTAPIDHIRVYDGDNTSAPLIGDYSGNSLQGQVTSGSSTNPTGCLTVQFTSNNTGTGVFAAVITCYEPCERPIPVAFMSEAAPALVCTDEVVSFDGSGSFAAMGFNITQYTWDFDDGTTASTQNAQHSFSEPGEYVVQLTLLDDNNCVSSELVDLQVLVSTTPTFEGTVGSTETCLGATIDLTAVVAGTTWSSEPENNFGPSVQLPDLQGVPFTSEIVFTQFDPGQTLLDVNDLLTICASLEHTFVGDLVISASCPNGQSVTFTQQGGGGMDLGDPSTGTIGTCWEYCWSPSATNGTWDDNGGNITLPAGTYESENPMNGFVGCPLNGTWTFTVVDLWAADDGSLCDWDISFDPDLYPDLVEFTPIMGSTPDSAAWSGPFLTTDPNDPLSATATPTGPGDYQYTFVVTDNFGCSYDTTVTFTIAEPLEIEAGPDIVLCSDPEPMAGQLLNAGSANCTYVLNLFDTANDGWGGLLGQASVMVVVNGTSNTYTLAAGGFSTFNIPVSAGAPITISYTGAPLGLNNNQNSFILLNDQGNNVFQSGNGPSNGQLYSGTITCGGGTGAAEYVWSPATGLTDPTSLTTEVYTTTPTWYYLTAYPVGHPECAVVDSVLVGPDPSIDAGTDAAFLICATASVVQLTDSLGGTPDAGGTWTTATGAVIPNAFDPTTGSSGTYVYTVTSPAGCVANATLDITVIPANDPTCCGVPDAGEPDFSCTLSIGLNATPGNTGVGQWTGPAGAVFANAGAPQTTVTLPVGSGGTHWFYWRENDGAFCNTVDSVQMTLTDPIVIDLTWTDAVCNAACDGTASATVIGGNAATDLSYAWSNGDAGPGLMDISGLCAGTYGLAVSDDNGCSNDASVVISEPVQLEIDAVQSTPVTCSGDCDGTVQIQDTEAVSYSYDAGASWSPEAVLMNACEGVYSVSIRNADGCSGDGTVTVTGPPPVEADFAWGPIPANINDPTIRFFNTSTGSNSYQWDIAGLFSTTDQNTEFRFSDREPGVYTVCLVTWNTNQCVDTTCHDITIDDILFTYVPNAFTPDGDGINDAWGMSSNVPAVSDFEMYVFDRWGQVIYSTTDPYQPWLGSANNGGEILPPGVFPYLIRFEVDGAETRKELVGHVTLVK